METCTHGKSYAPFDLRTAINQGIDPSGDEQTFMDHPLTNWLELKIALKDNNGTMERGIPRTIIEIANELKIETEHDLSKIENTLKDLLRWTELLNLNRNDQTRSISILNTLITPITMASERKGTKVKS